MHADSLPDAEPLLPITFNMTLLLKADIPRGSGILGQVFLLLHATIPPDGRAPRSGPRPPGGTCDPRRARLAPRRRRIQPPPPHEAAHGLLIALMDTILDQVDFDQDQPLLLLHVIPLASAALLTAGPPHAGQRALPRLFGHAGSPSHPSELADIARAVARPAHGMSPARPAPTRGPDLGDARCRDGGGGDSALSSSDASDPGRACCPVPSVAPVLPGSGPTHAAGGPATHCAVCPAGA
ncbi:hypothetical protein H696_05995 [Fonticula alba]|uniref:Uncharacterized protein n=1 Tax=Fonticula alba TaxID=691883 RepID=A0A058Z056_FONAL|nr:hypothetical protein H696_05995 [Fonticula alba]KCV67476.1 hypothetical protein H696_05995 [Fonticula alba]|eukprot:XP_009498037.1 hypothetical protein H696_05995 [Fonticula alba]